jgi:hypothetical protein
MPEPSAHPSPSGEAAPPVRSGGATGGLTDLARILATLTVTRRPSDVVVVGPLTPAEVARLEPGQAAALIEEPEGWTAVVPPEVGSANRWTVGTRFAWLTLDVHTSLEAVGLTAAVAAALAQQGIPANVIAAFHHDHILVPADRADDAIDALTALSNAPQ